MFNLSFQSVEKFHKFYFRVEISRKKNLDDLDEKNRILQQLLFLTQCHRFFEKITRIFLP